MHIPRGAWDHAESSAADSRLLLFRATAPCAPAAAMAFVPAPSPTVVDQTTLMKKYLQFVAALTDTNTRKLTAHVKIVMDFLFVLFNILHLKEPAFPIRMYSMYMQFVTALTCLCLKWHLCSAWAVWWERYSLVQSEVPLCLCVHTCMCVGKYVYNQNVPFESPGRCK